MPWLRRRMITVVTLTFRKKKKKKERKEEKTRGLSYHQLSRLYQLMRDTAAPGDALLERKEKKRKRERKKRKRAADHQRAGNRLGEIFSPRTIYPSRKRGKGRRRGKEEKKKNASTSLPGHRHWQVREKREKKKRREKKGRKGRLNEATRHRQYADSLPREKKKGEGKRRLRRLLPINHDIKQRRRGVHDRNPSREKKKKGGEKRRGRKKKRQQHEGCERRAVNHPSSKKKEEGGGGRGGEGGGK